MSEAVYDDKRIYWIWTTMVLGAASSDFWKLTKSYGSVAAFAQDLKNGSIEHLKPKQKKRAEEISFEDAESVLKKCLDNNVGIVSLKSHSYPKKLLMLKNPPPVIFYRGNIELLNSKNAVAVVGSRNPCDYSIEMAKTLSKDLAKSDVMVVTGCESGIDCTANEAAADENAPTVAVCGRGIFDENVCGELGERIAESGVLLSEFTDNSDYVRVSFDNRNRILCALSSAVVFVECAEKGHSLNNVKHAEKLSLPVFAVSPLNIDDAHFFGQRNLLENGALPVFNANDILDVIMKEDTSELGAVKFKDIQPKKDGDSEKKSVKKIKKVQKVSEEGLHKSENSVTIDISGFSQIQVRIYNLLKENGPMHLNQIAERLDLLITEILNELIELQIEGAITELAGKQFYVPQ